MKLVATIVLVVYYFSLQAQTVQSTPSSESTKREFKNQGEQEDFWAEQLFVNDYVEQAYTKYAGYIKVNSNVFTYGKQQLVLVNTRDGLGEILSKGFFYPSIIMGYVTEKPKSRQEVEAMNVLEKAVYESIEMESFTISNLEELPFLSKEPGHKRFRFWLYRKISLDSQVYSLNPQVCFIELSNSNATRKTDLKTFLEEARLTFYKAAWTVI